MYEKENKKIIEKFVAYKFWCDSYNGGLHSTIFLFHTSHLYHFDHSHDSTCRKMLYIIIAVDHFEEVCFRTSFFSVSQDEQNSFGIVEEKWLLERSFHTLRSQLNVFFVHRNVSTHINNNDDGDTFQFHSLFRNELLYSTTHRAFYFVCSPIHGYSNDEIYMSAMSQSIEVVIFFISTPDQQRCAGGVQGGRFWLKQTYGLLPPPMHSTPK